MAIHKIKHDNFVLWTGDEGLKMLNEAVKKEIDKQLAELADDEQQEIPHTNRMFEPLKKEDMHYYKRPTSLDILEMFKQDLTEEEYNELKTKFTNGE